MIGVAVVFFVAAAIGGLLLGFAFRKKRAPNPEHRRQANKIGNQLHAWGLSPLGLDGVFEELGMENSRGVYRRLRDLSENLASDTKTRPQMREVAKALVTRLLEKADPELEKWLQDLVGQRGKLKAFEQVGSPNEVELDGVKVARSQPAMPLVPATLKIHEPSDTDPTPA